MRRILNALTLNLLAVLWYVLRGAVAGLTVLGLYRLFIYQPPVGQADALAWFAGAYLLLVIGDRLGGFISAQL